MSVENRPLEVCTPESAGIDSSAILQWLQKLKERNVNMHGFCLLRHGKIAAEASWAPFTAQQKHRLYSTSKSMVSVAIGMLADQGKIDLDDRIAPYFPEKCPDQDPSKLHPYIAMTTIRDMLKMSTTNTSSSYRIVHNEEKDWVKTFFEIEPNHVPGTVFLYDTSAPTVMAALVEKLTGMSVCEFLLKNGFEEMGISPDMQCVKTPDGKVDWFGSGALVTLHDLAKFGQMCLHYGNYFGKQIVSEKYMRLACSQQIDNGRTGYGYQFWISKKGFACHGMAGQFAFMLPQEDLVLVTNADTEGPNDPSGRIEELMYDFILPGVGETPKAENPKAYEALKSYCADLKMEPLQGKKESPLVSQINGCTYELTKADPKFGPVMNFDTARLDFAGEEVTLTLTNEEGEQVLHFGFGHFVDQIFPGFKTAEEVKDQPILAYGFEGKTDITLPCRLSAAWQSDTELSLICYSVGDFLGVLRIKVGFRENYITLYGQPAAEELWKEYRGFISGKQMQKA